MGNKVEPSSLNPSRDEKINILIGLLQQNREEIRFWQEKLFTASFWLNAAILGIVAFVLRERVVALRGAAAFGCVCLAVFHLVIAIVAKRNIESNGRDLLLIQGALLLTESDQFIPGRAIYEHTGQ